LVINSISYLVIALLSFALVKKNRLSNLLFLFVFLSVLQGASFFYWPKIQPYNFVGFLFILGVFSSIVKCGVDKAILNIYSPLIFIGIFSIVLLLLMPLIFSGFSTGVVGDYNPKSNFIIPHYTYQTILQTFKTVYFIVFCFTLSHVLSSGKISLTKVYSFFVIGSLFVISVAVYNFFLRINTFHLNSISAGLLKSDILFNFIFNAFDHSGSYGIQSTFNEPSMFARYTSGCLFGFFNIINFKIHKNEKFVKEYFLFFILLVLSALCQSSSMLVSFVFLFIYIFFQALRYSNYKIIYLLILCLSIVLVLYFTDTSLTEYLKYKVLNKINTGSGIERSLWNTNALSLFKQSYFLGVGIGFFRASSFYYYLLSNFGLLGLLSVLFLSAKLFKVRSFLVSSDIFIPNELRFFEGFLLGAATVLIISNPNFTHPDLWISLGAVIGGYVYLSRYNKNIKIENKITTTRVVQL
jgi:hypothetical protein